MHAYKINLTDLNLLPVPLPPLAEQHRIAQRFEQAFSALDTIEALQAKYADNLSVLKSKLIDAAIQGKLTEQLPEDGTAEELYQQIQAEKQSLIKAGKIKKEKPLPEISADEIPFERPSNWKWCRIGSILTLQSGKIMSASGIENVPDDEHMVPLGAEELVGNIVAKDHTAVATQAANLRQVGTDVGAEWCGITTRGYRSGAQADGTVAVGGELRVLLTGKVESETDVGNSGRFTVACCCCRRSGERRSINQHDRVTCQRVPPRIVDTCREVVDGTQLTMRCEGH